MHHVLHVTTVEYSEMKSHAVRAYHTRRRTMPFITKRQRDLIEESGQISPDPEPGERCYVFYRDMVRSWKSNRRWTEAHRIYRRTRALSEQLRRDEKIEDATALELAWQVFFYKHVIPYENEKEVENGTI
jgi:hypothetical protein